MAPYIYIYPIYPIYLRLSLFIGLIYTHKDSEAAGKYSYRGYSTNTARGFDGIKFVFAYLSLSLKGMHNKFMGEINKPLDDQIALADFQPPRK